MICCITAISACLRRAKALGDYLIVGVTAEDFDKTRGKINVQQSLMERIEACGHRPGGRNYHRGVRGSEN